jgi:hypothetical protein
MLSHLLFRRLSSPLCESSNTRMFLSSPVAMITCFWSEVTASLTTFGGSSIWTEVFLLLLGGPSASSVPAVASFWPLASCSSYSKAQNVLQWPINQVSHLLWLVHSLPAMMKGSFHPPDWRRKALAHWQQVYAVAPINPL